MSNGALKLYMYTIHIDWGAGTDRKLYRTVLFLRGMAGEKT